MINIEIAAKSTGNRVASVTARTFSAFHTHPDPIHPTDPHRKRSGVADTNDGPWMSTRNWDVAPAYEIEKGVVVPGFTDTLEWVLDSPPNVHQFEEPPV